MSDRGYIALARSFIDDLRFRRPANRPYSIWEAAVWLIGHAAWKPRAIPTPFGPVHNNRAQLSTTERALAAQWHWSKSKVHRFLKARAAEGMISLALCRAGPESGPKSGYERTLITLCNYDKFNLARKRRNDSVDQNENQKTAELPGLLYPIATQPRKPIRESFKNNAKTSTAGKLRPTHGQRWQDLVFLHYETDDWKAHAADYEIAKGYAIFPKQYRNGMGNWFVNAGEMMRKA